MESFCVKDLVEDAIKNVRKLADPTGFWVTLKNLAHYYGGKYRK